MEETGFEYSQGTWQGSRKRIGERHQVGMTIRWRHPGSERRRMGRRRRDQAHEALAHDLSVSGARLLIAASHEIARGQVLEIEIDGATAPGQVAWVEPSHVASEHWCGVVFVVPDEPFMAAVLRSIDAIAGVGPPLMGPPLEGPTDDDPEPRTVR